MCPTGASLIMTIFLSFDQNMAIAHKIIDSESRGHGLI